MHTIDSAVPPMAVVGIDLGGTKIDVAVADLGGDGQLTERIETRAVDGAEQAVDRAVALAALLLARGGRQPAAVGLAAPGAVSGSRVTMASNLPGLDGLDILQRVGAALPGVPVALVNDLNAAVLAASTSGELEDVGTGMVVGLGTGLAAGLVIDGVLRTGSRGAAGEIGFARVPVPDAFAGPGPFTTVERVAAGGGFDALAAAHGLTGAAELMERAELDPGLLAMVGGRLDLLCDVLAVCCHLLDPQRVVFHGGLAGSALVRRLVGEGLSTRLATPVELVWLSPARNVSLEGALLRARALLSDVVEAVPGA